MTSRQCFTEKLRKLFRSTETESMKIGKSAIMMNKTHNEMTTMANIEPIVDAYGASTG